MEKENLTAVEWLVDQMRQRKEQGLTLSFYDLEMFASYAKAMEKDEKIEFACKVAEASAEKYIQGKTTWQIAEELLTIKSE